MSSNETEAPKIRKGGKPLTVPTKSQYETMIRSYRLKPTIRAAATAAGVPYRCAAVAYERGWPPKMPAIKEVLEAEAAAVRGGRHDVVQDMIAVHQAAAADRMEAMKAEALSVAVLRASAIRGALTLHETIEGFTKLAPKVKKAIEELDIKPDTIMPIVEAMVSLSRCQAMLTDSVGKLMDREAEIFSREAEAARRNKVADGFDVEEAQKSLLSVEQEASVHSLKEAMLRRRKVG